MARWSEIEEDAPAFAARVRERFDAGTNKTIATLRRDGSPRISATELKFERGNVTFGMMGGSLKLRDVRRDPRVAIHSPTLEPPKDDPAGWPGDAKLAGVVAETSEHDPFPDPNAAFFTLDISEVVLTYLGTPADHLVIESWHQGRGWERRTRA
jgi:pyridoxamine 5'-phosphate oxidase-like protein